MRPDRKVSEIATGRWVPLLINFGIDPSFLKNRHGPCPVCAGKDRFRFDDKGGRGTWYCNQCGSGDGFKLLELFKGWTFREAAQEVEQIAGTVSARIAKAESDETQKMTAVKRIWNETAPTSKGDPAWLYLNQRTGLDVFPASLRYHPALAYKDGDSVDHFPALVAAVSDSDGLGIGVHRIYLTADGKKAPVEKGKKLLAGKPLSGAAVRLGGCSEALGIAEGIETALCAASKFGVVTWAAVSAVLMEQWSPPESVRRVIVFGDNDDSFTGQAAAYTLAKRLTAKGIECEVRIPHLAGHDWADGHA